MLVAVSAWLWPIGFGGKMPVGGDVTQFSLGLMSVLGRALRAGRLPLWNELWGYGFPGVGESQMGVFYPPHWVLYGLFTTETAYTLSLVVHTLWASLGAYYAARTFGASRPGSATGGFAWAASGFYFVHLPHHWAATTGSWMPWAWGLAWSVLRGEGRRRDPFLLTLVLTLQLLPGHFQLAFCTLVGIVLIAAEAWISKACGLGSMVRALAAVAGAFPLAALQLWPTLRLARLAGDRRDFEYLSGFAATPLHLVTFVTPRLFERSPLWRLIVWNPFHTSPEEYLGFVGLVPLILAFMAVAQGLRASAAVRALAVVVVVTLAFGFGPYCPGFRLLIALPGFSFFRAPSRWMLANSLALCLLGSLGFDAVASWRRPGRTLAGCALFALAFPFVVVLILEIALASARRPVWPGAASVFARTIDALPWHEPSVFDQINQAAHRPFVDRRVEETWARQGVTLAKAPRPVFFDQRWAIYREELTPSLWVFGGILGLAAFARGRGMMGGLVVLTFLDLWSLGRERRVDFGPIVPLTSQSPVLARLAKDHRGERTIDSLRNMPMVAGAAPLSAYRTLDLPALESLTNLAGRPPLGGGNPDAVLSAFRVTGAGVRVFDPGEGREPGQNAAAWPGTLVDVDDPALAGWLLGRDLAAQTGRAARVFRIGTRETPTPRAWLLPMSLARSPAILEAWSGDPIEVLDVLRRAAPLTVRIVDPEHREIRLRCDAPSLLIAAELADPQWRAVLTGPGGVQRATVEPAFRLRSSGGKLIAGGWQAVRIPGGGEWTLRLNYEARDVAEGLIFSGFSAILFLALFVRYGRGPVRGEGEKPS